MHVGQGGPGQNVADSKRHLVKTSRIGQNVPYIPGQNVTAQCNIVAMFSMFSMVLNYVSEQCFDFK